SKFYRAETSSPSAHGTGLGLFLARGLLAAMGGRIWVESKEGQGATFVCELPAGNGRRKDVGPKEKEEAVVPR
ncbi:MAG: ATP-binding protein, partial [Gaiellaceae bacterium]